jgi:hypothetical protein
MLVIDTALFGAYVLKNLMIVAFMATMNLAFKEMCYV